MWLAVVLLGCKKVEAAPEAVQDPFRELWDLYDDGSDAEVAAALDALADGVEDGALDPPEGSLDPLTDDAIAAVGITGRSAAAASGVFIVHTFPCSAGQLEEILSYGAQDALYEGVYSSYRRDFDGSRDAWLAGDAQRLGYTITYTADPPVGSAYDAQSRGDLRRVGSDVVQRSYLLEPAVFEGSGNSYLDQDYQLEVYLPRGGQILHVYAMWRDAQFSGFNMEDESFQRIVINNMHDWDEQTATLCAEGRP